MKIYIFFKSVRMGTTLIRITLIYEEECSHKVVVMNPMNCPRVARVIRRLHNHGSQKIGNPNN